MQLTAADDLGDQHDQAQHRTDGNHPPRATRLGVENLALVRALVGDDVIVARVLLAHFSANHGSAEGR